MYCIVAEAAQTVEILLKLQCDQVQYLNHFKCAITLKLLSIKNFASAYKSYSPDVMGHVCLV